MSEVNERKQENTAPETAENITAVETEVQATAESKTSAPKKNKKKKKRAKIALPAAALLLVIALLFGMVVGYGFGRNVGAQRLQDAQAQIAALTASFEEAAAAPVYDAFNEELTGENQNALNDLFGGMSADDSLSEELSEDALIGRMLEGGEQESVVVAEFEGGKLMSDEVAAEYEQQLASLVFSGYNEEDVAGTLLTEVMRYMVIDRLLEAQAKEMGLYDLTDADREQIEAEANAIYNSQLEFFRDYVDTAGMTEEEATGAVKNFLQESEGMTLDSLIADLEDGWWAQKMYNEITGDVAVDDAQLKTVYDELLAAQKESFSEFVDDYEYAQMSGETIVYNLPGYRAVRILLLGIENPDALEAIYSLSDEIAGLDPEADAEMIARYQAEIDAWYAPVKQEAQAVLDELQAGADFMDIMDAHGDDSCMKNDPLRETGYYISKDSLLWPAEIIDAAMALENAGDVSGPIATMDGICILQYVGDVPAGEVPMDDVRDLLLTQALDMAKFEAYDAQMNQWLEQANVVYYPERMQ